MGFSSQSGQLILRTQTAQGTYNADVATGGVAMKTRSGTLGPSRELLIPDPEIGGGRDVTDALLGAVSWAGDYEFYARPDSLATLLRAALGTAGAPATTAGVTTHTITPSDSSLPYLSIEERISSGLEVFQYTDCVVNTLHLEADANGYLMGTVGLIAARQVAGGTASTPTYVDELPLMVGTNIAVQYNGVTLPAKSFSLDINNNFEDDDFRLGSFYIGDLTPKRREVTASFNIREANSALWRQAVYGTSAATQAGGVTTKQALVITASTYEDIVGGAGTKYQIGINIPKYTLTPFALSVSGDDIIEDDIAGQALRPAIGTPLLTATIKTGATGATIK
jgi:hypothetical protein